MCTISIQYPLAFKQQFSISFLFFSPPHSNQALINDHDRYAIFLSFKKNKTNNLHIGNPETLFSPLFSLVPFYGNLFICFMLLSAFVRRTMRVAKNKEKQKISMFLTIDNDRP